MAKATTKKAVAVRVAQTREEAERMLAELGIAQREVAEIETRMNAVLAKVKEDFENEAKPLNATITSNFASIQGYAEANRDALLADGSKTVKLSTGELKWRLTPPSVRITGADVVIETLKRLGMGRFVRPKEEINKEAILSDTKAVEGVKGIDIGQTEEFVVKPFSSEIERAATSKKVRQEAA